MDLTPAQRKELHESGYHPCGCRDCMEIAIGLPGALCWACHEAGCEADRECRAPDAYGAWGDTYCYEACP